MNKKLENELRNKILEYVLTQRHKPYIHGKMGKDAYDCAGLVWHVYNEILDINIFEKGIGLSTTTMIMTSIYGENIEFQEESLIKNIDLIKKGDILFFHRQALMENMPKKDNKYPGHCGIYIGDNKFIHCSRKAKKVIISKLEQDNYWFKKLVGYKNIFYSF